MNIIDKLVMVASISIFLTKATLEDQNVQRLLQSNTKFDLVIYENFLNDAFAGFSYHFNAPCVLLNPMIQNRWSNLRMGNPNNPAYTPEHMLSYSPSMSFYERLYNSLVYGASEMFERLYTHRKQNALLHTYFHSAPHLDELKYNTSLGLQNTHYSLGAPAPFVPNVIEVSGYYIKKPKPLPSDLQSYLDNAKEGVILFSMGSTVKSFEMEKKKLQALLAALEKQNKRVLWKQEQPFVHPANIKVVKWLPQNDVLADPNVKLFITQGGLLSINEAIYHGVPLLGIPVYGDQERNIANAEHAGYGARVPYKMLTEAALTIALDKILNNTKYTMNAKKASKIFRDRDTKPLDTAIYWIEYVIRHQGVPYLKTAVLSLSWYQYLLLDVVVFIMLVIASVTWTLCKIVRCLSGKAKNLRSKP